MNAEPDSVCNSELSLSSRSCCTCGVSSEPYVAVAMRQPPPPDVEIAMFVDPTGWKPVRTRNLNELSKIERYEYVQNRELCEANKGIILI